MRGDGTWAVPAGGGGGAWGSITGTLSSQTDLQTALNAKAASSHTHGVGDLTATGTRDSTTFLRGDNTWATPPAGGGGGTVTSVAVADATGITWAGSPITGGGTLTPTLSANLQAWHALSPTTKADVASPTFTGTPSAPTASAATNTTQIATTAYVKSQGYTANAGTVTSVALSGGTTGLSSSGGPITSSGTITLAGTLVAANGGTGLSSYTTGYYLNAASASTLQQRSPANVLADIGALAASSYTAADVLTKIKTVDGASSGIDSDMLDGQHGSYYAPTASPTITGTATISAAVLTNADSGTVRIPRIFVQSGDPGAHSADGDIWIW